MSHLLEAVRIPSYRTRIEKLLKDEDQYIKGLEILRKHYYSFFVEELKGPRSSLVIEEFFNTIKEIQTKHASLITRIQQTQRTGDVRLGTTLEEWFLTKKELLLESYKIFFSEVATLLDLVEWKIKISSSFYHKLLKHNKTNYGGRSHLFYIRLPMKRFLGLILDLEEFMFLTSGLYPMDFNKMNQTKTALHRALANSYTNKATTVKPVFSEIKTTVTHKNTVYKPRVVATVVKPEMLKKTELKGIFRPAKPVFKKSITPQIREKGKVAKAIANIETKFNTHSSQKEQSKTTLNGVDKNSKAILRKQKF